MAQDHTIENILIDKSRNYDWKDRDIASRYAADICEIMRECGRESTISALETLRSSWNVEHDSRSEALQKFGAGLEFLFHEDNPAAVVSATIAGGDA